MQSKLKCIECGKEFPVSEVRYKCDCGDLLEVRHDMEQLKENLSLKLWDKRLGSRKFPYSSGVWRYKELVMPDLDDGLIISKGEGNTNLYSGQGCREYTGIKNLFMKHEGENPTGSFKDRGLTTGITAANTLKMRKVACASTGNTSAALASYASYSGMESYIFVPEGKIAAGKLAQTIAYGARIMQVQGNFDDAMKLVQQVCSELGIYLLNSINPFRLEGQKTSFFEALQQLDWEVPDWFVLPGGNLGNSSALGKGMMELKELGLVEKVPRIAVVQAEGANPFYRMWKDKAEFKAVEKPETLATAIRIGNPINWKKSLKGVNWSKGVVEEVTDQEIMDAKAVLDATGVGAEPGSAASIAGAKKLVEEGVIGKDDTVVAILTGNILKDPDSIIKYHLGGLEKNGIKAGHANRPVKVNPSLEEVKALLNG